MGAVGVLCCCQLLCYILSSEGAAAIWDGDLLCLATSPDLMLATVAVLGPSLHLSKASELLVCHDQRSHSSSFISSASMAGSSQRTPSPVLTRWRPICPSVMHRTNFSQGVSSPSRNVTHALAVLYRNSSLPTQRAAFQVS